MSKDKMKEEKHKHDKDEVNNVEQNIADELNQNEVPQEDQLKVLEVQVNEWQDKYLRKVAEFENYKRRTENEQLNLLKYAAESFIIKLLPVIDDFERSLQHIKDAKDISTIEDGLRLVYNKLMKTLEGQGIKKIGAIGQPFDVHYHEAILQQPNDSVPAHTVLEEVQSGYVYKDKVIRHSQVIVSEDLESDREV
ncbi:MAG TPA: nucleotide exchange factor GrpE [Ignavibacteriaceae bacterium]|nr:nucleotide exchange factor GrpE [Ignavibacteriaceae bacterium]